MMKDTNFSVAYLVILKSCYMNEYVLLQHIITLQRPNATDIETTQRT